MAIHPECLCVRGKLRRKSLTDRELLYLARELIYPPEAAGHLVRLARRLPGLLAHAGIEACRIAARNGALLHDLGKVLFSRPELHRGPLSREEAFRLRQHPVWGDALARTLTTQPLTLALVRSHHERWDGTGYPDGLRGGEIPRPVRLFSVLDAWDAMTHTRPYRCRVLNPEEAVRELRREAGSQFEPQAVNAFLAWLDDRRRRPC